MSWAKRHTDIAAQEGRGVGGGSTQQIFIRSILPRTQPRRLSLDENVRSKEGGKETTGETSGKSCVQDAYGGKSNGGRTSNF